MRFKEIAVLSSAAGAELVAGALIMAGADQFVTRDAGADRRFVLENDKYWDYVDAAILDAPADETRTVVYIPETNAGLTESVLSGIDRLRAGDWGFDAGSLAVSVADADDADWLDNWKKYLGPVKCGGGLVVCPSWADYSPEPSEIVFTCGTSNVFGTGQHQSTRLCAAELTRAVTPGCRVADLGCGSGILAIAALLLGAGRAFACDFDPEAAAAVCENLSLNPVDPAKLDFAELNVLDETSLLAAAGDEPFDVVAANIVADVVIALAPTAARLTRPGGVFIAGGIIAERLREVDEAVRAAGFAPAKTEILEGWAVLAAKNV
ncbi:MAG: 50S ribosomal protein L11 methyltransferase [Clostridiales bacterium]|jgi:ribosomal protein L11 methyltransferase|nr:50S ribosomal protein L11 methyltransferase [Clostridiales bacterium]